MDRDDREIFDTFADRKVTSTPSTTHSREYNWMIALYNANSAFHYGIEPLADPDLEKFTMRHDSGLPNIDEAVEAEVHDRRVDYIEDNLEEHPEESEEYHRNSAEIGIRPGPIINGIGSFQDFGTLCIVFKRDRINELWPNGFKHVRDDDPIVDYITKFVKPLDLDVI
jgi:hypothetical protein